MTGLRATRVHQRVSVCVCVCNRARTHLHADSATFHLVCHVNGQSPADVVQVCQLRAPFKCAPSVPANRDGVGGNVVLNNGAGPLGTTLPPNLPAHQRAITSSKQAIMRPHRFTGLTVFTTL